MYCEDYVSIEVSPLEPAAVPKELLVAVCREDTCDSVSLNWSEVSTSSTSTRDPDGEVYAIEREGRIHLGGTLAPEGANDFSIRFVGADVPFMIEGQFRNVEFETWSCAGCEMAELKIDAGAG